MDHPTRSDLRASHVRAANTIVYSLIAFAVLAICAVSVTAGAAYIQFWLLVWLMVAAVLAGAVLVLWVQARVVDQHNRLCNRLIDQVLDAGDEMARPLEYGAQWERRPAIMAWHRDAERWRSKDES